jgi:ferredoxin
LNDGDAFVVRDADDGADVAPPGAPFHRVKVIPHLIDADLVINLPKAKTHGQMMMTAAVKNSFGAVVGMEKAQWHFRAGRSPKDFARLLLHVHALINPRLSILDAVTGMEGNGPSAGDPRPLGFLMASTNAHALDTVLARIWGLDPQRVPTLAAARDLGLLPAWDGIQVVGSDPEMLRPRPAWRLAGPAPLRSLGGPAWFSTLLERLIAVRPEIDRGECIACGECARVCAAHAIALQPADAPPGPPVTIDREQCIACFCCQEMCPEGAIRVRAGLAARVFGLGTR